MKRVRLAAAVLFAIPSGAWAGFSGWVVKVPEGDTLMVKVQERVLNLHLMGIDAPDAGAPFSRRAQRSLAALCENKPAVIDDLGFDSGRRIFGRVECEGIDAAAEQVRRGMARVTERPAPDDPPLAIFEQQARAAQLGVWGDPNAPERAEPPSSGAGEGSAGVGATSSNDTAVAE